MANEVELDVAYPVGFDVGWDVGQPPPFIGFPVTNIRITEADDTRVTEADDTRITSGN